MTAEEPEGRGRGGSWLLRGLAILALVVLLVAVFQSVPQQPAPTSAVSSAATYMTTSSSPTSLTASSLTPSTATSTTSTSHSAVQSSSSTALTSLGQVKLCSPLTASQQLQNAQAASGTQAKLPTYDEQLWMGFEQNLTSTLAYNVTVRAQNDSFGYGPAFIVNGLTDQGYWYQAGVAWNWASGGGTEFNAGFRFLYEVWDTNTHASVFPSTSGTIPQSFGARDGDLVLLSLTIEGGQISMRATDWNTGSKAQTSFNSYGASEFVGYKSRISQFPTSLLTEWYHVLPYFCVEQPVVYSNTVQPLASAWLHINEWNLTGVPLSQRFNPNDPSQCCVFATGYQGVGFSDPAVFQSVSANGTTIYASATRFVTI